MSNKDPQNAIERLTDALKAIATSPKDASARCKLAQSILWPLSADGHGPVFPEKTDKDLFKKIINFNHVDYEIPDQAEKFLKMIWELYWNMSKNKEGD